jgi:hypothetical protein
VLVKAIITEAIASSFFDKMTKVLFKQDFGFPRNMIKILTLLFHVYLKISTFFEIISEMIVTTM